MDSELIDQPRRQGLVDDVRAAPDNNVLVVRSRERLVDGVYTALPPAQNQSTRARGIPPTAGGRGAGKMKRWRLQTSTSISTDPS